MLKLHRPVDSNFILPPQICSIPPGAWKRGYGVRVKLTRCVPGKPGRRGTHNRRGPCVCHPCRKVKWISKIENITFGQGTSPFISHSRQSQPVQTWLKQEMRETRCRSLSIWCAFSSTRLSS